MGFDVQGYQAEREFLDEISALVRRDTKKEKGEKEEVYEARLSVRLNDLKKLYGASLFASFVKGMHAQKYDSTLFDNPH